MTIRKLGAVIEPYVITATITFVVFLVDPYGDYVWQIRVLIALAAATVVGAYEMRRYEANPVAVWIACVLGVATPPVAFFTWLFVACSGGGCFD